MKRRCAWCGVIYGHSEPLDITITTHGMCADCHRRLVERAEGLERTSNRPDETPPDSSTENDEDPAP